MRILGVIILVFGVALAGGAVFFASKRYQQIEAALAQQAAAVQPTPPEIKTVPVIVANVRLPEGRLLNPDHVRIIQFPEGSAPANSFTEMAALFGDGVDYRRVLRDIAPNEPVLSDKVSGFGAQGSMEVLLGEGMRAFTIKIDAVSGVGGFILPDSRVDIYLTTRDDDGAMLTSLVLQNIKVIAVDQFAGQDNNAARIARTATVEVTPDQAQRLALTQSMGPISLALRQINETDVSDNVRPVVENDIVPPPERVVAPPKPRLCVRKGTELICSQ